jgi:hypothetical protein
MMRVMGMNAAAAPQGVSGSVTLVARRMVGDIPCLEYRFKVEVPARPRLKEPPGFENTVNELTAEGSLLVPLDPSLPVMEENFTLEVHSRSEGSAQGAAATVELRVRDELHLEREALPAAPAHGRSLPADRAGAAAGASQADDVADHGQGEHGHQHQTGQGPARPPFASAAASHATILGVPRSDPAHSPGPREGL